jgi:hypothetical protein
MTQDDKHFTRAYRESIGDGIHLGRREPELALLKGAMELQDGHASRAKLVKVLHVLRHANALSHNLHEQSNQGKFSLISCRYTTIMYGKKETRKKRT